MAFLRDNRILRYEKSLMALRKEIQNKLSFVSFLCQQRKESTLCILSGETESMWGLRGKAPLKPFLLFLKEGGGLLFCLAYLKFAKITLKQSLRTYNFPLQTSFA